MDARKSIVIVKNMEFLSPRSDQVVISDSLSPVISPRSSNHLLSLSPKVLPRSSLQAKMQRLNEMRLYSIFESKEGILSTFNSIPKPNICISELWGSKENYLKKTGYLKAYKELQKQHDLDKLKALKSSKKVLVPYKADIKCKAQVFNQLNEQTKPEKNSLKCVYNSKDTRKSMGKHGIDLVIQKCSDFYKKNSKIHKKTEEMKKIIDSYTTKRTLLSTRLTGLSKSTSEEIMNKRNLS